MSKAPIPHIPASDDDLGSIFICAVRYCIGRATYMPHLVADFITPYIPHLNNRTLSVMIRDIQEAPSYGMDCDQKMWMTFLQKLQQEADRRKMRSSNHNEKNERPNQ